MIIIARLFLIYKKERTCHVADFAVPAHRRVTINESEKIAGPKGDG